MARADAFRALLGAAQRPLAECFRFASSRDHGPIMRADVMLVKQLASNMPIQIVDQVQRNDRAIPRFDTCQSHTLPTANDTQGIGAARRYDYGEPCRLSLDTTHYSACANGVCAPIASPRAPQYRVINSSAALR